MLEDNGRGHGSHQGSAKRRYCIGILPRPQASVNDSMGDRVGVRLTATPSVAESHGALPMSYHAHRRFARREHLGLTPREFAVLRRLSTPQKVQSFLNAI